MDVRQLMITRLLSGLNRILQLWAGLIGFRRDSLRAGQSVVVIRNGNIGDHVAALPVYRAIRAAAGQGSVSLVTTVGSQRSFGREFLEQENLFDRIVVVPPERGVRGRRELVRVIRSLGCEYAVYLPPDKARARQIGWAALALRLAGLRMGGVFRVSKLRLFRRWQGRTEVFPSETQRLLALIGELGIPVGREPSQALAVEPISVDLDGPIAAVCPGGEVEVNHWPDERYLELCGRLVQERGWSVVLLGGPKESQLAARITAALPAVRVRNLVGQTSLLEAAGVLRSCTCLVSNDTSIGHIAAAVGKPVLTVLSARDFPGSWLPDGPNVGVRRRVDCEVCYRRTCPTMHCIRSIEVSAVLSGLDSLLEGGGRQVLHV